VGQLAETTKERYGEMGRFLAHITTLSSGSIVVLATFAERFSGKGPTWLLAVSAAGFATAIGLGLVCWICTISLLHDDARATPMRWLASRSLFGTGAAFAVALACLAVFAAFAVT
jgi:hypothetical protein